MRDFLKFVFVSVILLASSAPAQMKVETIQIRVENGRNGKPVKCARAIVNVYPMSKYETPTSFITDREGDFSMLVLSSGEVSTILLKHLPCQYIAKADRKKPRMLFPVEQILTSGVLSPNTCGSLSPAPQPGTLILYVRPSHWWQMFSF